MTENEVKDFHRGDMVIPGWQPSSSIAAVDNCARKLLAIKEIIETFGYSQETCKYVLFLIEQFQKFNPDYNGMYKDNIDMLENDVSIWLDHGM